ncbi:gamma-glutamyltransferase [Sphingosinicella microcystinivorans]|uniref:gamma-glutamyltransferase n=1 Tax=Sphingosinicella microcystinivorans TaxID=335406 RepID=UPI0022F3B6BA|nr:gamma-glutamyltransferase [Sphingosinicella microcystinivorans]WBX85665.1 gamma-glutamyltransferase [Sphingosinicella microcystinivorans]
MLTHPIARAATGALFLGLAACAAQAPAPSAALPPPAFDDDSPVYSSLVSAAHPLAADAGKAMLAAGGSAADAALATMLALTVVEPQSSGIGGGGFLLYHDAESGRLYTIDGRETAPKAATPTMFLQADGTPMPFREAVPGGKSVGVPGNIRLMAMAHARFGRLPWAKLFEPAIRLARDGFEMSPRLHEMLAARPQHAGMTEWAKATFFHADDTPRLAGETIRNPMLARFFEKLAKDGPDAFYRGAEAARLVNAVASAPKNPQAMTVGDLGSYKAVWRDPVCGAYRTWRVCGMAPPSSGGTTVLAILKQLERFDLRALGPNSPESWHLIAESMRLAYADREAYLGDPDFVPVPTAGLVDPAYLSARGALIDPARAAERVEAGTPPGAGDVARVPDGEVPSTSHFAAADRQGDVASYTSTIEGTWGSGLTVNGFFLNNELTDFSMLPEADGKPAPNRVQPGKRPRSSMAPTIVYDPSGKPLLAIGAAGGSTIIAQVAKALVGVLDWEMDVEDAIALPQIYAPGNRVTIEAGSRLEAMIPALTEKGHAPTAAKLPLKANGIERKSRGWIGGADPRSEGAVAGL